MAGTPGQTIYPFAEMFEVATTGTTSIDVWEIPAGTAIVRVLCEVDVAALDAGGANIIVGDDSDDNGYILAAALCGVSAGTVYGDLMSEVGAYLKEAQEGTGSTHAGTWKLYSTPTSLTCVCSAALDTEATLKIYVFGYRGTPS